MIGRIFKGGLLGFSTAMLVAIGTAASAQDGKINGVNYGTITYSYIRSDGVLVTEVRDVDMDAYVASGGANISPIQLPSASECDPVVLPTVPVFPPPAPPPSSMDLPPSTSVVDIYQQPTNGVGGWYQRVRYIRPVYPNPNGTWNPPGSWGNPQINQVHGQIPNTRCSLVSQ